MKDRFLGIAGLLLVAASCSKGVRTPPAPSLAPNNSFLDLQPGKLRIVLPLLSGTTPLSLTNRAAEGQTVTLSALGLVGYLTLHYTIAAARGGRVRLLFTSAESTKDGITTPEPRAPALPFALPEKAAYARLIYLQRASVTDHNMAIVASHRRDILENATRQVLADPTSCRSTDGVLCSWVPAKVAVRPEK